MKRSLPLFHPVALSAVLLLALNDHLLKRAYPGFVTGKLSDCAGMVFFPLLLTSVAMQQWPTTRLQRWLVPACLVTALAFAATKCTAVGHDAYVWTWGVLQWPFWALRAWWRGRATPHLPRISCARDRTDLLALPFLMLAYQVGRASFFSGTLARINAENNR